MGKDSIEATATGRVKQLPRYHLENYFLDPTILAEIFRNMEPEESWLRDSQAVAAKLREIAQSVIPYAVALNVSATIRRSVGNVSVMPKGVDPGQTAIDLALVVQGRIQSEMSRITDGLNANVAAALVHTEFGRLTKAVADDDPSWKADLPGRVILNKFAAAAGIQNGRLKQAYLNAANADETFGDIVEIFQSFRVGGP
jgi:hypothetical protein